MRILRGADRTPTSWKNGGGLTWEVAAWPTGASLADFEWRASIAEVSSPGPFSNFAGVDRVLTVLAGTGLELRIDSQAIVNLDAATAPFAFAGDTPCHAVPTDGPVRDFNVMVRRGQWSADVQRLEGPATLSAQAGLTLILACSPITFDGVELQPDDVILIDGTFDAQFTAGALLAVKLTRA